MRAFLSALGVFAAVTTTSVGALSGATGASGAAATTGKPPVAQSGIGSAAVHFGRSVGSPTEGHLIGGSRVEESPALRISPAYVDGDVRWGLGPLVGMIDRASRQVRRQFPDAVLAVGHLSRKGGGAVDRHHSHESGRDADLAFYVRTAGGKPLTAERFVAFKGDGTAGTWPGAHFDDARNWALVSALLTDREARVAHLFVATPLRARLLAYAERVGASPSLRARAAEVMVQPHGALPHDDHFHVRIACPSGMTGCIEFPTVAKRPPKTSPAAHPSRARDKGTSATPATPGTPGTKGAAKPAPSRTAPNAPERGPSNAKTAPASPPSTSPTPTKDGVDKDSSPGASSGASMIPEGLETNPYDAPAVLGAPRSVPEVSTGDPADDGD
ncbi:MAG: penicillin-insensitive murein endopeptidase [Polyangiaceae bacterium]